MHFYHLNLFLYLLIFYNRFREPGKVNIICDMMSFDYKGVNVSKELEINVLNNSEKRNIWKISKYLF